MSGTPPHGNAGGKPGNDSSTFSQDFQHANIGARVLEKVARGVFSTGVIVLQGPSEFVLDYVLRMNQPHQVVARVILPLDLMPRLIEALRSNLEIYRKAHGSPPALTMPKPPSKAPSIEEIYDNLKIQDDVLNGVYANSVLMTHSAAEFCFDFITTFYPKSAVSARILMSAPQVPVMLNTLAQSWQNYQNKLKQQPPPTS
jgi:Protein of unknown function (DUF3467)